MNVIYISTTINRINVLKYTESEKSQKEGENQDTTENQNTMPRNRNAPEGTVEHEVKFQDVNFVCRAPENHRVELWGDFNAPGGRNTPLTLQGRLNPPTPGATNHELRVPQLEVGRNYRYYFKIIDPGGGPDRFEPGPGDRPDTITVREVTPALSPTTPASQIEATVKESVNEIITALKTREGAEDVNALVERLQVEMQTMGMTGAHTQLILKTINEVIAAREDLPAGIRNRFRNQPPPANFPELERRLREGSDAFSRKVFLRLRADPKARAALHLRPGSDRFSDNHSYELFRRIVEQHVPGNDAVAYIGAAFERSAIVPPVRDDLRLRMNNLRERVVARLTPHQRSFLSRVPASRKGKILDVVVQLGSAGLLLTGAAPIAGLVGLAVPAALETLSGISKTDVLRSFEDGHGAGHGGHAKGLWETFKENNLVSRMLTTEETSGSVVKHRFGDWLKRMIPFSSFWYGGKGVDEHGEGHGPEAEEHEGEEEQSAESLIRAACEKELRPPAAASRASA